jgi:ATP-dependent protease ClpP protease subunit
MEYQFIISGIIGQSYDWWTGQRGTTAKDVRNFLDAHKDQEVDIAVSSPGGLVDQGLDIYDAIQNHGKVNIHIIGMTASAATLLCMGAKHIDMVDGSLMLIHNASSEVLEWESANKEELDRLIAKYKKMRNDLNTIDKVIASLYAKRSGKSLEDCMAKMTKAEWLSPEDALSFGLIDSIRTDEAETKNIKNCRERYINLYNKEYGLPSFAAAADKEGPTTSLIQKTVDAIKSAFRNNTASKKNNKQMIKIFKNVMDLLNVDGFNPTDYDSITVTQEQMKTIDDRLGEQAAKIADLQKSFDEQKATLDQANADLKNAQDELAKANETIENLKKAPGAATQDSPADTRDAQEGNFLAEAEKQFKLIKDL